MAVQRWTSRRRAAFLKALTDTGNVSAAARAARASRSRAYQLKAADPGFAAEWADALRTELRWLGSVLGPARDLDVMRSFLTFSAGYASLITVINTGAVYRHSLALLGRKDQMVLA